MEELPPSWMMSPYAVLADMRDQSVGAVVGIEVVGAPLLDLGLHPLTAVTCRHFSILTAAPECRSQAAPATGIAFAAGGSDAGAALVDSLLPRPAPFFICWAAPVRRRAARTSALTL